MDGISNNYITVAVQIQIPTNGACNTNLHVDM